MPLVVFLLLALVCLALLGFACACLTDQPALAIERALQGPALAPAVVAVWTVLLVVLLAAMAPGTLASARTGVTGTTPAVSVLSLLRR